VLEFQVPRAIQNGPIAHEVDAARQRELWLWVAMGLALAAVLLFSAWQHVQLRFHGYRAEQLQQERDAEEEINRQLRLEIESLRDLARIERYATRQLGFVQPGPADTLILPRAIPAEMPATSVVAAR